MCLAVFIVVVYAALFYGVRPDPASRLAVPVPQFVRDDFATLRNEIKNDTNRNLSDALAAVLLNEGGSAKVVDLVASRLANALVDSLGDKLVEALAARLGEMRVNHNASGEAAAPAQPLNNTIQVSACPRSIQELIGYSEVSSNACLLMWPWRQCNETIPSLMEKNKQPKEEEEGEEDPTTNTCNSLYLYEHSFDVLCYEARIVRDFVNARCEHLLAHVDFWGEQARKLAEGGG
jgi:hypothetical protein